LARIEAQCGTTARRGIAGHFQSLIKRISWAAVRPQPDAVACLPRIAAGAGCREPVAPCLRLRWAGLAFGLIGGLPVAGPAAQRRWPPAQ